MYADVLVSEKGSYVPTVGSSLFQVTLLFKLTNPQKRKTIPSNLFEYEGPLFLRSSVSKMKYLGSGDGTITERGVRLRPSEGERQRRGFNVQRGDYPKIARIASTVAALRNGCSRQRSPTNLVA